MWPMGLGLVQGGIGNVDMAGRQTDQDRVESQAHDSLPCFGKPSPQIWECTVADHKACRTDREEGCREVPSENRR